MLKIFKIPDNSLEPFYKNGEKVLCRKVFITTSVKENDIVILSTISYGEIIKRVKFGNGIQYFLESTNFQRFDCKNLIAASIKDIKYKVLFKI